MALSLTGLGAALEGGWRPGIGDPTALGWVTVVAYFIAAVLSYMSYRACRLHAQRAETAGPREAVNHRLLAFFWLLACVTLTALGGAV